MKKVFVQTFGCQMNVYDTGKINALLGKDGYTPTGRWMMPTSSS